MVPRMVGNKYSFYCLLLLIVISEIAFSAPNRNHGTRPSSKHARTQKSGWTSRVEDYEEHETLKAKSTLKVYRAIHLPTASECVLKRQTIVSADGVVNSMVANELNVVKRILNEKISSDYVVKFHTFFEITNITNKETYVYIVMEHLVSFPHLSSLYTTDVFASPFMAFVRGNTLFQALNRGKLKLNVAIHFIRHVLHGVHALTTAGIQHNDLFPQNVVIATLRILDASNTSSGADDYSYARAVLIDFGKTTLTNVKKSDLAMSEAMNVSMSKDLAGLFYHIITGSVLKTDELMKLCLNSEGKRLATNTGGEDAMHFLLQVLPSADGRTRSIQQILGHSWLNET